MINLFLLSSPFTIFLKLILQFLFAVAKSLFRSLILHGLVWSIHYSLVTSDHIGKQIRKKLKWLLRIQGYLNFIREVLGSIFIQRKYFQEKFELILVFNLRHFWSIFGHWLKTFVVDKIARLPIIQCTHHCNQSEKVEEKNRCWTWNDYIC